MLVNEVCLAGRSVVELLLSLFSFLCSFPCPFPVSLRNQLARTDRDLFLLWNCLLSPPVRKVHGLYSMDENRYELLSIAVPASRLKVPISRRDIAPVEIKCLPLEETITEAAEESTPDWSDRLDLSQDLPDELGEDSAGESDSPAILAVSGNREYFGRRVDFPVRIG